MDNIFTVLKGKALGIPLWLWGAVLVGVGALYLKRKQTSQPAQGISETTGGMNVVPAYVSNFPGVPTGIDYNGVNYYPYGTLLPPGTGSPTSGAPTPPDSGPPSCPPGSHAVRVPLGILSTPGNPRPSGWMCVPDSPASSATTNKFIPNLGNVSVWLFKTPASTGQSNVAGVIPPGTLVNGAGPAVTGAQFQSPFGGSGNVWQPVTWNGQTLYAFSSELSPVGAV